MEKSTAGIRKFGVGLLAALLLELFIPAPVQKASAVSWAYLQTLKFRKADKYFFTNMDCSFSVNIETVSPDKVAVSVNDVPEHVSFVSMKKETYIPSATASSDQYGTTIILAFRFDKPGSYQIRALDLRVDQTYSRIAFEPVYVYENPRSVKPQASISFSDPAYSTSSKKITVQAGKHLEFTLSVKYAIQIESFAWSIPQDSLFTEVKRYEITQSENAGNDFSPDAVPVATFDWQPLKEGDYEFPSFDIIATSFGGIKHNVSVPEYKVHVEPGVVEQSSAPESALYAYAFAEPAKKESEEKSAVVTTAELENLLELHQKERHSFPVISKAAKERRQAEINLGLSPSSWAASVPLLILLWALTAITMAATILLFVLKKIPWAATILATGVFFLVTSIFYAHRASLSTAIFKGGGISTIPEESCTPGGSVPTGTTVQIVRKAGGWLYIKSNDTYGWVPESSVMLIK